MLENVLPEFQTFLFKRELANDKHIPFLALWVKKYIDFIKHGENLNILNSRELYLKQLALDETIKDWQLNQANIAIDIYLSDFIKPQQDKNEDKQILALNWILDNLNNTMRLRNYSSRTIKSYKNWITNFYEYLYNVRSINIQEIPIKQNHAKDYLTYLVIEKNVAPSTQNQAFNALLFLYKNILKINFDDMGNTLRAKRACKIPVVLTLQETQNLINHCSTRDKLFVELLYGTGMRLSELCKLRIQDICFDTNTITIKQTKGDKDRTTVLPNLLKSRLQDHILDRKRQHDNDLTNGVGHVNLPYRLELKFPNASTEFKWQYLFPSSRISIDKKNKKPTRFHMSSKIVQTAVSNAAKKANILKHVTVHTLRHSFATHLLQSGVNIREIQDLLGHKNLETTMIYTHVLRNMSNAPASPLDTLYST